MRILFGIAPLTAISVAYLAAPTTAQEAPLVQHVVDLDIDSDWVNGNGKRGVVYSTIVEVPDAAWLRLKFAGVVFGGNATGLPSELRVTSLLDGASQTLNQTTLKQWRNTSAYFNGDAVLVQIIASPEARGSRVVIDGAFVGDAMGGVGTICGNDDRLPSDDPRAARALPVGCTAWLINDVSECMLTAGHCVPFDTIQFNVPESNGNGTLNHPPPSDQYAVDNTSWQSTNGGLGNDWGYFGVFPNTETGLPAGQAQGAVYELSTPPAVQGQSIRITGYGVDNTPLNWNQIQQTNVGPYDSLNGTIVEYVTDTEGGNSGSPVVVEETGLAIGIHTNGGCTFGGGANLGTGLNNANIQNALLTPQGVCLPAPPLDFTFPDGLPELLDPSGAVIRVLVSGANDGEPEPGTGQLHYDTGDGFTTIDMTEVEPNVYDAMFPAIDCGTPVNYYFSASDTLGEVVNNPLFAPDASYTALSAVGIKFSFEDNFQTDQGWTVAHAATAGKWERGVPVNCVRGDPPADADGSGNCYLTENDAFDCNSDVDDGSTTLTSPIMDASSGSPVIGYWRWYSNTFGDSPMQDIMVVEVSDDGGASWTELEVVGPAGAEVSGGWFFKQFSVADFVNQTDEFQIRFTASDTDPQSVVEAAIDGVQLFEVLCDDGILGDIDGDGIVGTGDLLLLLGAWGPCDDCNDCAADLDNDCSVGTGDLLLLLGNWG